MKKPNTPKTNGNPRHPAERWKGTNYTNLIQSVASGIYFVRARVRGKLIRKSLKTSDEDIARRKMGELLADELALSKNRQEGKWTVGECEAELIRRKFCSRTGRQPRTEVTQKYYGERLAALWKYRNFRDTLAQDVTPLFLAEVMNGFRGTLAARSFNGTLWPLRWIFEIAIEKGAPIKNPARHIEKSKIEDEELRLPNKEQFKRLVTEIETAGSRHSIHCANLVRFLAFGGFRIAEARRICWADINWENKTIRVFGKGSKVRHVPIIEEMDELLRKLTAANPDHKPTDRLMHVGECQKSLTAACKRVGIARLTHHSLRHLFATICVEARIDFLTISRWLGHKDATLVSTTYAHLRDAHSEAMSQLVGYGTLSLKTDPTPPLGSSYAEKQTKPEEVRP